MELLYWPGDWELASVEPISLAIFTYCQFAGADIKLTPCTNPRKSASGSLPVLQSEEECTNGLLKSIDRLREKGFNADFDLSRIQAAEVVALCSLVEQKLKPALLYTSWCDTMNYDKLTQPWFGRTVPFPFNFWYLSRWKHQAVRDIDVLYGDTDKRVADKIYAEARECLNVLAERLGASDFYFGVKPSTLDAIVYGYVAPLLKIPYPENCLRSHIEACPSLTNFCARIQRQNASLLNADQLPSDKTVTYPILRRIFTRKWWWDNGHNIATIAVALATMTAYGVSRGILWQSPVESEVADVPEVLQNLNLSEED